jgi:very-short-patch-repair endonuclease
MAQGRASALTKVGTVPIAQPPPAAARQGGLFTQRQARAYGITAARLRRMVASGRWVAVVGDVLTVAGVQLTTQLRLCAATLATGGFISHDSAAELWGLPAPRSEGLVHVTVTVPTHRPLVGLRIHRRPLRLGDRSWFHGVDVTSRRRTVLDCLLTWPDDRAAGLIDHVLRTGTLTIGHLRHVAESASGAHGAPRLRELVEASSAGTWSEAERRFHALLRRARVPGWVANHALALDDGRTAVVDVWFPGPRVAVELDGHAWHSDRARFQRDRTRQNALILAGVTVLRFTWDDIVHAPERIIRDVRTAVSADPNANLR